MTERGDDAVRKEFQEFRKRRKGYLVDEQSFIAGWEAGRSAAIQECADLVDESISDVPTWPLRDAILALKER